MLYRAGDCLGCRAMSGQSQPVWLPQGVGQAVGQLPSAGPGLVLAASPNLAVGPGRGSRAASALPGAGRRDVSWIPLGQWTLPNRTLLGSY